MDTHTPRRTPPKDVAVARARKAAATRWAGTTTTQRRAALAPAREAYDARWRRLAAEKWPHLDGADLDRAAENLCRAHLAEMQLAAARARRARRMTPRCGCGIELTSTASLERGQCWSCARKDT